MASPDPVAAEPDRMPGAPHPRERTILLGHEDAERDFAAAARSGRLHHAWLIGGPRGIGKASFAYRAARFLLASGTAVGDGLDVPATHPVARQVAAQSHPNLAVLRRAPAAEGKAAAATIGVDSVRRAMQLFGSTASDGGHRVCIVDAADDLTVASANALLKMVEEPPPRSVFLIVSHAPQRLLPTIRSRCRRLALAPLGPDDLRHAVGSLGPPWADADDTTLGRASDLADGSVRRALELIDPDKIALVDSVTGLLDELPRSDLKRLLALAEMLHRRGASDDFDLVLETVQRWASDRVRAGASLPPARLAPLVEVCEKVAGAAADVETYNLDRRPLIIGMFGDLAEAVARAA